VLREKVRGFGVERESWGAREEGMERRLGVLRGDLESIAESESSLREERGVLLRELGELRAIVGVVGGVGGMRGVDVAWERG
jgi:hypothetical protein